MPERYFLLNTGIKSLKQENIKVVTQLYPDLLLFEDIVG